MLSQPENKYRPWPPLNLPDRTWPEKRITHAPRWLSTDLRDGNQALAEPMDSERKLRSGTYCWSAALRKLRWRFLPPRRRISPLSVS